MTICLEALAGVTAVNLFFSFLVKGFFFPSGPFSLIDVRSFFAACLVFVSFLSAAHCVHNQLQELRSTTKTTRCLQVYTN